MKRLVELFEDKTLAVKLSLIGCAILAVFLAAILGLATLLAPSSQTANINRDLNPQSILTLDSRATLMDKASDEAPVPDVTAVSDANDQAAPQAVAPQAAPAAPTATAASGSQAASPEAPTYVAPSPKPVLAGTVPLTSISSPLLVMAEGDEEGDGEGDGEGDESETEYTVTAIIDAIEGEYYGYFLDGESNDHTESTSFEVVPTQQINVYPQVQKGYAIKSVSFQMGTVEETYPYTAENGVYSYAFILKDKYSGAIDDNMTIIFTLEADENAPGSDDLFIEATSSTVDESASEEGNEQGESENNGGTKAALAETNPDISEGGSIDPGGRVPVANGYNQSFLIVPNQGYQLYSFTLDGNTYAYKDLGTVENLTPVTNNEGESIQGNYTYMIPAVTANHTLNVEFATNEYIANENEPSGPGTGEDPTPEKFTVHASIPQVNGVTQGTFGTGTSETNFQIAADEPVALYPKVNPQFAIDNVSFKMGDVEHDYTYTNEDGYNYSFVLSDWYDGEINDDIELVITLKADPNAPGSLNMMTITVAAYTMDEIDVQPGDGGSDDNGANNDQNDASGNEPANQASTLTAREGEAQPGTTTGGIVSPGGEYLVEESANATFLISANEGYQLYRIKLDDTVYEMNQLATVENLAPVKDGDGGVIEGEYTYLLPAVTQNHTLDVYFASDEYIANETPVLNPDDKNPEPTDEGNKDDDSQKGLASTMDMLMSAAPFLPVVAFAVAGLILFVRKRREA